MTMIRVLEASETVETGRLRGGLFRFRASAILKEGVWCIHIVADHIPIETASTSEYPMDIMVEKLENWRNALANM